MGTMLEDIPVYQLLEESLAIKSLLAERFGVTLEIRLDDPRVSLRGDRGLLRAALGNLIDNAIRENTGKRILISQRTDGDAVIISVSNSGGVGHGRITGGIGRALVEAPRDGDGSSRCLCPGMSLAIRIADLHGGVIDIGPDDGNMCDSSIYLPLSRQFTSI
jgi:K+-sensing histidine kinase KdpD